MNKITLVMVVVAAFVGLVVAIMAMLFMLFMISEGLVPSETILWVIAPAMVTGVSLINVALSGKNR